MIAPVLCIPAHVLRRWYVLFAPEFCFSIYRVMKNWSNFDITFPLSLRSEPCAPLCGQPALALAWRNSARGSRACLQAWEGAVTPHEASRAVEASFQPSPSGGAMCLQMRVRSTSFCKIHAGACREKRKMLQFFSSSYKENGNFGALFCFDQSVVGVAGLTALNRVAACLYIFFHGGPSDGFRR